MPEDTTNNNNNNGGGANQNQNNNNNSNNGGGNDTSKKTDTQVTTALDLSKIGDEDFSKIFDDPRLWKHPRFSTLNERAKKADEYEATQKQAEEETLKKKGEFETLAKKAQDERDEWKNKYTTAQIDNSIQAEAAKAGVVDLEAVLKLIDRNNLKVGDDGKVVGVEEAVKSLLEGKPYLKGKPGVTKVGNATNPGENTDNLKRFKLSQLQDPVFYRANEKDIEEARKHGLIENDLNQS